MRVFLLPLLLLGMCQAFAQLTAVSFNIRYDNAGDSMHAWADRRQPMAHWLLQTGADVIGIQEGLYNQVTYLDSILTDHVYVGVGREDGKQAGEYAALFIDTTRFLIMESSTFWLSERPDTVSTGWDAALPRVCTYALLKEKGSGKLCWAFNTHFDHMGARAREESARLIASRIAMQNSTTRCTVVLTGDLNAEPADKPLMVLGASLSDGYIGQAPHAVRGTWNAFDCEMIYDKRIDYVMVTGTTFTAYDHVRLCEPDLGALSDHWPVIATIDF